MGALVTVQQPGGSAVAELPWVVTFGPLDEEEDWEPIVCGPYERPHAVALAAAVVAEDDLMAVVEPVLPRLTAAGIRDAIAEAQRAAAEEFVGVAEHGEVVDEHPHPAEPPTAEEVRTGFARIAARLTRGAAGAAGWGGTAAD